MRWSGLRDYRIYQKHIFEMNIGPETYDNIIHNDYFSHAVRSVREVISEASKNVSDIIKDKHQEISWRVVRCLKLLYMIII